MLDLASSEGFVRKMTPDLFVQLETAHFSFLSEQKPFVSWNSTISQIIWLLLKDDYDENQTEPKNVWGWPVINPKT